ncbi:MAG: ATP-binding protein [Armatimonadetes bacterium]|nr:ATP-binding protein [Armatimonadota bacterium]
MTTRRRDLALMVPGEAEYLCLVRDLVTTVARKAGFPDCRIGEIEIAVDEACANIIEHAYGRRPPGEPHVGKPQAIAVRLALFPDRIEVRIRDRGRCFPPEMASSLDIAEFAASGRRRGIGSYIIRSFVDEVHHSYRPGRGNELTLVKYLAKGVPGG